MAGQKTQSKQIGDSTFAVSQLPAMRALKMLNRLGRILGPALAKVTGGMADKNSLMEDGEMLSSAMSLLFERLTEQELESVTKELLGGCTIDGKELMPQFDFVMQGRMDDVMRLLAFAVEVNYGSFFAILRSALPTAAAAQASLMAK